MRKLHDKSMQNTKNRPGYSNDLHLGNFSYLFLHPTVLNKNIEIGVEVRMNCQLFISVS